MIPAIQTTICKLTIMTWFSRWRARHKQISSTASVRWRMIQAPVADIFAAFPKKHPSGRESSAGVSMTGWIIPCPRHFVWTRQNLGFPCTEEVKPPLRCFMVCAGAHGVGLLRRIRRMGLGVLLPSNIAQKTLRYDRGGTERPRLSTGWLRGTKPQLALLYY
jgi:hypothetical protein